MNSAASKWMIQKQFTFLYQDPGANPPLRHGVRDKTKRGTLTTKVTKARVILRDLCA